MPLHLFCTEGLPTKENDEVLHVLFCAIHVYGLKCLQYHLPQYKVFAPPYDV